MLFDTKIFGIINLLRTINKKYLVNASVEDVWKALTDPKLIEQWSAAKAKMDDKKGSGFKLWNGDIFGKNIEVVKNKKLVQEWYSGKWDKPSIAEFTLLESNGKTNLNLVHTNVPDKEVDDIDKGWDEYYLNPLKDLTEK